MDGWTRSTHKLSLFPRVLSISWRNPPRVGWVVSRHQRYSLDSTLSTYLGILARFFNVVINFALPALEDRRVGARNWARTRRGPRTRALEAGLKKGARLTPFFSSLDAAPRLGTPPPPPLVCWWTCHQQQLISVRSTVRRRSRDWGRQRSWCRAPDLRICRLFGCFKVVSVTDPKAWRHGENQIIADRTDNRILLEKSPVKYRVWICPSRTPSRVLEKGTGPTESVII